MKKPSELKKKDYTVQINYSKKSKKNKTMKFITPKGDTFEISAEEMMTMLVGQVNAEALEALSVDTEKIDVVEVQRQIVVNVTRDIKKGEEVRLDYYHPYPVEFALIEEAMKIAKINKDVPAFTLTPEYIEKVRKKIKPEQKNFVKKFYAFFKNLLK